MQKKNKNKKQTNKQKNKPKTAARLILSIGECPKHESLPMKEQLIFHYR